MKLKIFLFVALLSSFAAQSQTIVGNTIQAYNNLTLHGKNVTGISNDSTLQANDSMKLPTQSAVKGYVDNRVNGLGTGTNNPDSLKGHDGSEYQLKTDSSFLGVIDPIQKVDDSTIRIRQSFIDSILHDVFFSSSTTSDSLFKTLHGVNYLIGIIDSKQGILYGCVVSYVSGLTYYVSSGAYKLGSTRYTWPGGYVTLPAADANYATKDDIILDSTGATFVAGTPSANPASPQLTGDQWLLSEVTVNATATVPAGVSASIIYDENTEWTHSQTLTVDYANTVSPFSGTTDAYVSSGTSGQYLQWINGSTFNPAAYTNLTFNIRLDASMTGKSNISVQMFNSVTNVSTSVVLGSANGFSKNTSGAYQTVTIPLSAFNFSGSPDRIRFTYTGNSFDAFRLDYVTLQAGVTGGGSSSYIDTTNLSRRIDSNSVAIAGKQDVLTLTTNNTSGAATLIDNILNIPQYSAGGTDSASVHVGHITVVGDSAVVFSDLKGNSDTVGISLLQYWKKNGNKLYNPLNTGIGDTDTPYAKLTVTKNGIFDSNISDSMGVMIGNLDTSSTVNQNSSPPLIFRNYGRNNSTGFFDSRVRIRTKGTIASSTLAPVFYIESSTDGGKTYNSMVTFSSAMTIPGQLNANSFSVNSGSISGLLTIGSGGGLTNNGVTRTGIRDIIGPTTTPYNYAASLHVESTTTGFLPPRLTTVQRDSINLVVTSVTVVSGGSGYASAPFITTSNPTIYNLNATFTATVSGGAITSVTVNNGGSFFRTPVLNYAGNAVLVPVMTQVLTPGLTAYITDATATDGSTGVMQTWNGSAWKNNW